MKTCSKVTVRDLPSERKCQRLLHQITFGTQDCPYCASLLSYRVKYAWCTACRKKIRVKAATWLKDSHLSFQQIWLLLLAWQHKQSPGAAKLLVGISYTASRRWFLRFREHLPQDLNRVDGVVEVDESFFGKQKFGHQTIVVGAKARAGGIRLQMAHDRSGPSLVTFLLAHVVKHALLLTDDHDGYLAAEAVGYVREVCVHEKGQFGLTAGIENIWSRCKCQMRRQYGRFLPFYLKGWLKEWEARVNFPELFTSPEMYLKHCLVPC